jgi:hypothetical protein
MVKLTKRMLIAFPGAAVSFYFAVGKRQPVHRSIIAHKFCIIKGIMTLVSFQLSVASFQFMNLT